MAVRMKATTIHELKLIKHNMKLRSIDEAAQYLLNYYEKTKFSRGIE